MEEKLSMLMLEHEKLRKENILLKEINIKLVNALDKKLVDALNIKLGNAPKNENIQLKSDISGFK